MGNRKNKIRKSKAKKAKERGRRTTVMHVKKEYGLGDIAANFVAIFKGIMKKEGEKRKKGNLKMGMEIRKFQCYHLLRIGSSLTPALLEKKVTCDAMHNREYFKGAKSFGEDWEFFVKSLTYLNLEDSTVQIHKSKAQCFRFSDALPWLCATPDFYATVTYMGVRRDALIEVKSSRGKPSTAATALTRGKIQLAAALECFNLDIGFLTMVHLKMKKRTGSPDDPKSYDVARVRTYVVHRLTESELLKLESEYFKLLVSIELGDKYGVPESEWAAVAESAYFRGERWFVPSIDSVKPHIYESHGNCNVIRGKPPADRRGRPPKFALNNLASRG